MKKYKVEMHAHTWYSSCDSKLSPKELIVALKNNGYDGAVITNHFSVSQIMKYSIMGTGDEITKCKDDCERCKIDVIGSNDSEYWQTCLLKWCEDIRMAQYICNRIGFKVYAGMEYSYTDIIHLSILGKSVDEIEKSGIKHINKDTQYIRSKLAGCTILQNHPTRFNADILGYADVDGYEICNFKKGFERRDITDLIERKNGCRMTKDKIRVVGGDIHGISDIAGECMLFDVLPENESELAYELKRMAHLKYK